MNQTLYATWLDAVRDCFATDTKAYGGWGLARRYETKRDGSVLSHEKRMEHTLAARMEWRGRPRYAGTKRSKGDGSVSLPGQQDELWYELKSIYAPHFHGEKHPHNHDYERFLRLGHPCGALSDVERLRRLGDSGPTEKVFLLLMISWASNGTQLASYEQHREALAATFIQLAGLEDPSDEFQVISAHRGPRWSCVIRAWRL
jgi:hypothetical protein